MSLPAAEESQALCASLGKENGEVLKSKLDSIEHEPRPAKYAYSPIVPSEDISPATTEACDCNQQANESVTKENEIVFHDKETGKEFKIVITEGKPAVTSAAEERVEEAQVDASSSKVKAVSEESATEEVEVDPQQTDEPELKQKAKEDKRKTKPDKKRSKRDTKSKQEKRQSKRAKGKESKLKSRNRK